MSDLAERLGSDAQQRGSSRPTSPATRIASIGMLLVALLVVLAARRPLDRAA